MIYGLDHLGGAKYGDLLVREHPQGWAAGFFANTFGNAWPMMQKLATTGRCPQIRMHAIWEDDHTYNPRKHDPIIMRELKQAKKLAQSSGIEVQFSPFCEHNIKGQQLKTLMTKLLNESGQVLIVNSVWKGDFYQGVINEVHGDHSKPAQGVYNYSTDGSDCFDIDIEAMERKHDSASTFYFWTSQFNGKKTASDSTPRPQRKAWPTSQLIDATIYLSTRQGDVSLPKNWLNKPKSDQHLMPPEPRALKPVMIAPIKAERIELRVHTGQIIAVSSKPQPFADGRWRYYFDQYGYQISEKAKRISGSPVVDVLAKGKVYGTCNLAFRQGGFR